MNRIICIDLTQFNYEKLADVAAMYNGIIDVQKLIDDKKAGFRKLWLDMDLKIVVAFTYNGKKSERDNIRIDKNYMDFLESVKPIEVEKRVKNVMSDEDRVDKILDKISNYGTESLLKEEREFLEEFKNKKK